ncbi:hypothetical protein ABIE27_004153 [Paenibacillus sp. 4624]
MIYELNYNKFRQEKTQLTHRKKFSKNQFYELVSTARFELSHHDDYDAVVNLLCERYGFNKIGVIYLD